MKSKNPQGPPKLRASQNSGTYRVGYRRPPKEHQFKAGKSGNPKGRRKGAKNVATILREIFYRSIEVRDKGTVRKIAYIEALLRKFADAALMKGDHKAAALLLQKFAPVEAAEMARSARDAAFAKIPRITTGMTAKEAADAYAATLRFDQEFFLSDE